MAVAQGSQVRFRFSCLDLSAGLLAVCADSMLFPADPAHRAELTRVRVVGTGSIGGRYVRVLRRLGVGEVVAVSVSGRGPFVGGVGGVVWESVDSWSRGEVDLTVVATSTARHVGDALLFGGCSRAVLVEKPVALVARDAGRLGALAGVCALSVSSPLRLMRAFAQVREWLPDVGDVRGVEVVCESWLPDWRPGRDYLDSYSVVPGEGGVLRDLIHEVDYCLALFGSPLTVAARLVRGSHLGVAVESRAQMCWQFDGFSAGVVVDFGCRVPRRCLRVTGERGELCWDVGAGVVVLRSVVSGAVMVRCFPGDRDRDRLVARQVGACLWGVGGVPATLAEGIEALAWCDVARESDARGGVPWSMAGAGVFG